MKNGVLRIVSSVTKKVIEISKHQKQFLSPAAGGTASSSSAKSLESLLWTRTDGEPDFDRMDPEHARHLANVSQNYRNHYNKWRSKQNERDDNKRTGGGKQKGDFKGGSQGQPVRPENKAQDVPSTSVSSQHFSQQLSLTDTDMKRLATTMLKIQQERQDSDEKKKTNERPKEERVRFATTTCDMETYEVIRRGDVDMVFPDSDGPSGIYDVYEYNPFSERNVFTSESVSLLHQCGGGEENTGSTEEVEQASRLTETKIESSASLSSNFDKEAFMARFAQFL